MIDLINREAVIKALVFSDDTSDMTCGQMAKVLDVINAVPSPQSKRVNVWSLVFDELIKQPMFRMEYDAKHGSEHFMYGIATVMEYIAEKADRYDEYERIFNDGLNKSYEKAGIVEDDSGTTVICPNCGRSDYIRSLENDFGIKNSEYEYKCINCNTYIGGERKID